MNIRYFSTLLVAGTLTGCLGGTYSAPAGSSLAMPGDVVVAWSDEYNEIEDQVGMFIFADIGVDGPDGRPLDSIEVEVMSSWAGVYLLPVTAVKTVDYPSSGAGIETYEQLVAACDADGDGIIDASADDWCSWYWDASSGEFYELASDFASVDGYGPTYHIGSTDSRGLMRVYIYVDSLPGSDGTYTSVSISASIGVDSGSFVIGSD
jgi:hypothetical protein